MECLIIHTLEQLEGLCAYLREQGATDTTDIFVSSDEEGNNYISGISAGFSPTENYEYQSFDPETRTRTVVTTEGGAITIFPHGGYAEPIWEDGT